MDKAYKKLKMSEQKKREMIAAIINGKPRKQRSYVGIVAPLFVCVALLFIVITGQSNPNVEVSTGAALDLSHHTHEAYFKEYLILWTISLVLLMVSYVRFLLLAKNPKRLINYRIFRVANAAFHSWRMIIIAMIPFVWIVAETVVIMLFPYDLVVQFFVVFLLLLNLSLLQLSFVKDRGRATCPHCGVELTNKEIFLNKKCGVCGNGRHKKVQANIKDFIASSTPLLILLFPMFDFSMILALIYGVTTVTFSFIYVMPYLYEYEKEDEIPPPLW